MKTVGELESVLGANVCQANRSCANFTELRLQNARRPLTNRRKDPEARRVAPFCMRLREESRAKSQSTPGFGAEVLCFDWGLVHSMDAGISHEAFRRMD